MLAYLYYFFVCSGNLPNRSEALDKEEEELLWASGLMGGHTPYGLQMTFWFLSSKLCGFRAADESRKMKWGDWKMEYEGEDVILVFTERKTKTRQGKFYIYFLTLSYKLSS